MEHFPQLTPEYIDERMRYRDFLVLCDRIDTLERAAKRRAREQQ